MIRQESWKISTSMQRRIDTFTLVFGYRYKSWKAVDHICKQSAPRFRQITTPHQHLVTQFLQTGCFSWRPTNSVKALNALCKKINVKQSKWYRLFCFACIGLFYFTCVFPHISFHVWGQLYCHCSYRMWQGLCNGRVSVSSVCLYQLSTAAAACGGFAAGRPAGRRNSSIAARPGFQTATAPQQHGAQRQTRAVPRSEPP